jgi:hypothetical protein
MAVAKVQSAKAGVASDDEVVLVLGAAPTEGNLLWFYVFYYWEPSQTVVPPAGLTLIAEETMTGAALAKYARIVQSGDSDTWAFNFEWGGAPSSNSNQVIAIELSGQDAVAYHNGGSLLEFASATSASGTGVTPNVASCYPLSACGTVGFETLSVTGDDGTTFTEDQDQGAGGNNEAMAIGTLTADTVTAVNCTWGISSTLPGIVAIDLIAPASVAGGQPASKRSGGIPFMRLGGPTFGHGGRW